MGNNSSVPLNINEAFAIFSAVRSESGKGSNCYTFQLTPNQKSLL